MDRYSRSIYLSMFAVIGLIAASIAAALTVRFPVNLDGRITQAHGEIKVGSPQQTPAVFRDFESGPLTLRVGERVQVEPGGTATLAFFNDGIAILTGPAELLVRESARKGTVIEHIRQSADAGSDYTLIVAQNAGTVEYRFDHADPALDRMTIRIQLPAEVYVPTTPCWRIAIDAAGQAISHAVTCASAG